MTTISEVTFECEKLETEAYNASKLTVTATNVDSDILRNIPHYDLLEHIKDNITPNAFAGVYDTDELLDALSEDDVKRWLETRGYVVRLLA